MQVSTAGDVNGDGYDDLLIGAAFAGVNWKGESYVIYGHDTGSVTYQGTIDHDTLLGSSKADTIVANRGDDRLEGAGGKDVRALGARAAAACYRPA